MREIVRDKGRLEHMLGCIHNLYEFTENLSYEDYLADRILKFAVIKNLEIIGEAAYMLTLEFKENHPDVNWRDIVDMRHVLVHGYYRISDEMVWEIIHTDLQPLEQSLIKYLAEM